MIRQGGGAIVNISSIAGMRHLNVPTGSYSAAKGAVNQFTQNLALQYADKHIRANCVLPGYIDTPFTTPLGRRQTQLRIQGIHFRGGVPPSA